MKRVRLYRHAPMRPVPPTTCAKVCALLLESLDLLGRGVLVMGVFAHGFLQCTGHGRAAFSA